MILDSVKLTVNYQFVGVHVWVPVYLYVSI